MELVASLRRLVGGRPGARRADRLRVLLGAAGYPALLAAGTLLLRSRPAAARAHWLRYVSTDVANLTGHPGQSLVLSALICEGDLIAWMVLGTAGLAALGQRFGVLRALGLAFTVHVLATLASEGVVAYRIATGALPSSARFLDDVGPSYVVVAALVAAAGHGTRGGRVVGLLGFAVLAPSLFDGLTELDVAAVGHVCSIVLALLLGALLARRQVPRRPSADSNRGP